jgi:hypothetical protein
MSCFCASLPFLKSAKSLARRASVLATLALATLALASTSACTQAPADGDCDKLLLHLVEIEVNSGLASEKDRAQHKLDLADGSRAAFVKRCNTELKADQVTCTLKAQTSAEIEACDS